MREPGTNPMARHKTFVATGVAAALAIALSAVALARSAITPTSAAHGASDVPPDATAPEAGVAAAVDAYVRAHSNGDVRAAWDLVSARCTSVVDPARHHRTVVAYSVMYPDLAATGTTVEVQGGEAWVSYGFGVEYVDPVVREHWSRDIGGAWHWDDC